MEMHHPAKIPVGAGFLFLTSPPAKELKVMFNIILIRASYEICTFPHVQTHGCCILLSYFKKGQLIVVIIEALFYLSRVSLINSTFTFM